MVSRHSRALQAFRRVEAWFADRPAIIPASGSSAQALANQVNALTSVITRMTEQASVQTAQMGQTLLVAKDEVALRDELRDLHIKSIVNVANALRGQVPGVGVIKMPASGIRSEVLVKAAEALYTMASVYRNVFVEHGLPQDFLEQLASATAVLKSSVDARGVARSKRTGARTSLATDFNLGRRIVSMIDASLAHTLRSDSVTLASWRQVKRPTVKPPVSRVVTTVADVVNAAESTSPSSAPLALVAEPSAPAVSPDAHDSSTTTALSESVAA